MTLVEGSMNEAVEAGASNGKTGVFGRTGVPPGELFKIARTSAATDA